MNRILLFVLLALGAFIAPANAQQPGQALIVSSCGSQSLAAATYGYLTMDATGKLCDGASGSTSVTQGTVPWVVDTAASGNLIGAVNAGTAPTGSVVPPNAIYSGVNIGGNLTGVTGKSVGSARLVDVAINDASGNQIGTSAAPLRVDPTGTTSQPVTGAPCTPYHLPNGTAASSNSTLIATGARTLCSIVPINTGAALAYLKLYDLAAAPACNSATGLKHVYPIPFGTSSSGGGLAIPNDPETYTLGLGFCVVGGGADTDGSNTITGVYIEAKYR